MSIRSAVSVKLLLAIIVTGGPLLADTWIPPQIIPGNSFPVFSSGDVVSSVDSSTGEFVVTWNGELS